MLASRNSELALKEQTLRALQHLMRSDKRIFDAFRPTDSLLERIKLHELAMNRDSADLSSMACNIISFLLRYNPQIDYVSFSTDPEFVRTIRRFENVKYAAELEQLTIKIAEVERLVVDSRGGMGGQIDDTYLEARIHDKVREAVQMSALGGSI